MHEKPDGTFFFFQNLIEEKVHEIDIDHFGRLWIATENGILRKERIDTDTVFNKGKVVCICHAPDGTVWAGSNGYGLIKIENGTLKIENDAAAANLQSSMFNLQFITADDGLANNCVESVALFVARTEGQHIQRERHTVYRRRARFPRLSDGDGGSLTPEGWHGACPYRGSGSGPHYHLH